jgi:hypothetical protein
VLVGNSILEIKGMLFSYWAILFTVACMANMIGLNISAGLNSVVTAYIVIPVIFIPQLLFSGFTINFDRLNNFVRDPVYVPIIGEIMHTRWAFEAMAVHQFKDNQFNKELFPLDQQIKNAEYNGNFLIPDLQIRLNEMEYLLSSGREQDLAEENMQLVSNELQKLAMMQIGTSFGNLEMLDDGQFTHDLYRSLTDSLVKAKGFFMSVRNSAVREKDAKLSALVQSWGGKESYSWMKHRYTNNRLEEILTNKRQLEAMVEWDNQLVRKIDPIYMEPLSRVGRAHFYAPDKQLGNLVIDTFWFNLAVIWLSSVILYLTLVYDLLRRFTNWQQIRRLRRIRSRG